MAMELGKNSKALLCPYHIQSHRKVEATPSAFLGQQNIEA